ncbi:MAG: N-acyl-D-amino-acid deacylase family protein [Bacillota bacterium]
MKKNILIKNGTIVDGGQKEPYQADILLEDDEISQIGDLAEEELDQLEEVIDARDCYVTPGFIDTHSHTDLQNFVTAGLKPKVMQGVTTDAISQCGLSVAPILKERKEEWKENLIIGNPPIDWSWNSMEDFIYALQVNGTEYNVVPFVGHGTLRYDVKKDRSEKLNNSELSLMGNLTQEAFESGVRGLSLGLIYIPAVFYQRKEIEYLLQITSNYDGVAAVHLRSESDELVKSIQEMIDLATKVDCQLHISHLKAIGRQNWSQLNQALELINKYNITFDSYPYITGNTTLMATLPPFLFAGDGLADTLAKLKQPKVRQKVKDIFAGRRQPDSGLPWDNIPYLVSWDNIKVIDVNTEKNRELIGCTIAEIAEARNCSPADALMDIIIEESGNASMTDTFLREDYLIKILQNPNGVIGTDTILGTGNPHPRGYGTYPRIINRYVKQQQVLSIQEAIAKMTSKPAEILGLDDRGWIKEGYKADITIFNSQFADTATFMQPVSYPRGIRDVIVNGEFKVKGGYYQHSRPGKVLTAK